MLRQYFRQHVGDADAGRDGPGGALIVAGDHPDFKTELLQIGDSCRRILFDRVGDRDQTVDFTAGGDEHDGFSLLFETFDFGNRCGEVNVVFLQKAAGSNQNFLIAKGGADALTGNGHEGSRRGEGQVLRLCVLYNRLRQGVFGTLLNLSRPL